MKKRESKSKHVLTMNTRRNLHEYFKRFVNINNDNHEEKSISHRR